MASHRRGQPVKVEQHTSHSYLPVRPTHLISLKCCNYDSNHTLQKVRDYCSDTHCVTDTEPHKSQLSSRSPVWGARRPTRGSFSRGDVELSRDSVWVVRPSRERAPARCALRGRGVSQKSKNRINHQSRPPDTGNSRCPSPAPARVPTPLMAWRHRAPRPTLLPRARPSYSCP